MKNTASGTVLLMRAYASALGKSLIVIHSEEHQHALKEVDAAALAVVDDAQKVVEIFRYVMEGKL